MDWINLAEKPVFTKAIATIFIVVLLITLRSAILRILSRRAELPPTERLRLIVATRNATFFLIIGIVFIIWLEQVRTIAASLVVIAAAIVVATKEFLLNIVGYFYQKSFKFVTIGDRIEIDGLRGDVIDESLMGLTLMEIGPGDKTHQYTGMTIFVPNSKFLLNPVRNETHLWSAYVFHLMTIPIDRDADWKAAEQVLLEAANQVCRPYIEEAKRAMTKLALSHSLEEPTVDPRIQIQIADANRINLVLRMPVPTRKRGRLEQDVTRKYLSLLELKRAEPKAETTPP